MLKNAEQTERWRHVVPEPVQYPIKKIVKGYRRLTSGLRLLPDYLIIGARRCGTTSLYNYLVKHPGVLPALTKEIGFFDKWFDWGTPWYRSYFRTAMQKRLRGLRRGHRIITGEATPSYLLDPLVPARVHSLVPHAKLIVLLRNPVDAIYSAYHLGLKAGTYGTEVRFAERLTEELDHADDPTPGNGDVRVRLCRDGQLLKPFLPQGIYNDALTRWLDVFPRGQLLVLIYEDFFRDSQAGFDQVVSFLGLPPHKLPEYRVYNSVPYSDMDSVLQKRLADYYAPHNRRLRELLGMAIDWD